MVRIYGCSDDLVEIEGSKYTEDEIGCFEFDVRIWFDDGGIIRVGYEKGNQAIWFIVVEIPGSKAFNIIPCDDEDADIYSDIFETEAEVVRHEVIDHIPYTEGGD